MNEDVMFDLYGKEVRVGDEVAFVISGYSHSIKLRKGIVSKIRPGYNGRNNVATVTYTASPRFKSNYDDNESVLTSKSVMKLPRVIKIG